MRLAATHGSALPLHRQTRPAFSILGRQVHGKPLVYLDSAATSLRPDAVIDAEAEFYRQHNGNVHRGMHALTVEASELYEATRLRVAEVVGAASPEAVVFTRNTTAALNMVARGLEHTLSEGDEILLTVLEHHANLVPWIMLAKRKRVNLRHLPLSADGEIDLAVLPELLGPRTRIVALAHTSNVLGTVLPVREIADAAHRVGATVVVDAAQAVGHRPVNIEELGADLLAFSAHKAYGPMGVGVLTGRPEVLERLEPMEGGGEMILQVRLDDASWAELPHRLEAGTPNAGGVAGFASALDLLEDWGLEAIRAHEQELGAHALDRLAEVDGLVVYGPRDPARRGGLVAFHDPQVHPHDLTALLDQDGIATRAGHHCAQPLHRLLGVVATSRASFGVYTTPDEIDALVESIQRARRFFA